MNQQQHDPNDAFQWKRNFNIAWWLCLIHQRGIVILLRNLWGVQALGTPCALALVVMFLWATFSRDPFMWGWLGVWVLVFLCRRWEAARLVKKGSRLHSQYDGFPVGSITLGRTEKAAKMIVEPLLIGGLGYGLYWIYGEQGWSPYGLPYFLLTGCFTLPFVELVKQTLWERRTQAMLDGRIENEAMMSDFRDRYGNS
jgi:hypothetical protein